VLPYIVACSRHFSAGCAALLPKARTETAAFWKALQEIKITFDNIERGRITLQVTARVPRFPAAQQRTREALRASLRRGLAAERTLSNGENAVPGGELPKHRLNKRRAKKTTDWRRFK